MSHKQSTTPAKSGYDSDKDAYFKDLTRFINTVRPQVTSGDDELHWSDIGWTDRSTPYLGLVGYISGLAQSFRPSDNTHMKILFTLGVLAQMFKVYAISSGQALLPWYFVLTCPPLIVWRIVSYLKIQRHLFCLDYCYFGNLAVFLILVFAPDDPQLFILQFCIANGLLYTGAFSFRNSLVFHSVDKMTSTYIHSAPVLLVFGIRWFPGEASRFWYTPFPEEFLDWNVKWNVCAPLAFVCIHAALYTILMYGILKPEEHIITSFRYLKAKQSVKAIFGPNPSFVYFIIMQLIIVLVMTGVTILTYSYFVLNLIQVFVLVSCVTWNGAGYYVDVFRMSLKRPPKSS